MQIYKLWNKSQEVKIKSVEGEFDIYLDGRPADLKKVSSHNNIVKKAKHAVRNQGAEIVVFEFTNLNSKFLEALSKLEKLNIHGYYWVSGETKTRWF